MVENMPISSFRKLFEDFLCDLESVFPELKSNIDSVSDNVKNISDDDFVESIMGILEKNKTLLENEDGTFFSKISEKSLIGKLKIESIWTEELSRKNKGAIWKYLQTMLVVGSFIRNTSKNIANLLKKLNDPTDESDDVSETLKEQANMLGNVFSGIDIDAIQDTIPSGNDNVIMKLAEEMSKDIQSGNSGINPDQIMNSMMSGDSSSMVKMIEHIGGQIQQKITSGEIDQQQLISQAKNMADTLSKDPNISKITKNVKNNQNFDISGLMGGVEKMMGGGSALSGLFSDGQKDEMPDLDDLKKNAENKTKQNRMKVIDKRRKKK